MKQGQAPVNHALNRRRWVREHPMERLNQQATVVPSSRSYWSSEIERKLGPQRLSQGAKSTDLEAAKTDPSG